MHHDLLDALPPTDPVSERALLGAVLLEPAQLDNVTDISGADFSDPPLGQLFEALTILRECGVPLSDMAALLPALRDMRLPDSVTSGPTLAELFRDGVPFNAKFYAAQIRRCSDLRRLRDLAAELLGRTSQRAAKPDDITRWLDARLQTFAQRETGQVNRIGDVARELLRELQETPPDGRGIMTGLVNVDSAIGAWMPGDLVILAARPGVGKTSLALQVAMHNAERGRQVLFVSLEMRDRELVGRILCDRAIVDSRRLRAGGLESFHWSSLEKAANAVADLPLSVWSPPRATLAEIRAVVRRETAKNDVFLLVVDYIGLVRPTDPKRPRHEQVADISQGLKALAKELPLPVLALCQLNREADGKEPVLSHLRESGAIEQDADIVLFIHHDEDGAKLIIAKHRHGATGSEPLVWIPSRTRFADPSN